MSGKTADRPQRRKWAERVVIGFWTPPHDIFAEHRRSVRIFLGSTERAQKPGCTIYQMLRLLSIPWALLLLPLPASGVLANAIEWDGTGAVELEVVIAPGEKAEVCSTLARQQQVEWSFKGSAAVDFDIRYGQGANATYALRRFKMSSLQGRLDPPANQMYCWTWSNERSSTPTTINLTLSPRH